MKALIIQHMKEVPPGRVLQVLDHLCWGWEILSMEESQAIPYSLEGFDCLVLLGGTMNVDDTSVFPYLESLKQFTAGALSRNFPVIGLCLGAQLMSRAAGGTVYKNRCGEIGWSQVSFTPEGIGDKILEGVSSPLEVFQWHDDMLGLPAGSVLLAGSEQCYSQIVRMGEKSYGFQFHPEVDQHIILEWIEIYGYEVEEKLGPGGARRLERQTREKMPLFHRTCGLILTNYFRNIEGDFF